MISVIFSILFLLLFIIPFVITLVGNENSKKYGIALIIFSILDVLYCGFYTYTLLLSCIYIVCGILLILKNKSNIYFILSCCSTLICLLACINTNSNYDFINLLLQIGLLIFTYIITMKDKYKDLKKYDYFKYFKLFILGYFVVRLFTFIISIFIWNASEKLTLFYYLSSILINAYPIGLILAGIGFIDNKKIEKKQLNNNSYSVNNSGMGYHDMGTHIILLFVTFGIYLYIWIYRITKYTNNCKEYGYRDPAPTLLLCMFVPFYSWYWFYQTGLRIDSIARSKNNYSNMSNTLLILAIFITIAAPIVAQSKINELENNSVNYNNNVVNDINDNVADELIKYKKLLDDGAINEEEYEKIKKKILNI